MSDRGCVDPVPGELVVGESVDSCEGLGEPSLAEAWIGLSTEPREFLPSEPSRIEDADKVDVVTGLSP